MSIKKFGCYLFGSRSQNSHSNFSDVDLLLVCDSKYQSDLEVIVRIQLAKKFPNWKGLKLDFKHLPLGLGLPSHPVAVLIAAELKAKRSLPILGDHLLFQTIEISKDLLLAAQFTIISYWSKIFLTGNFDEAFSMIKSQRTLRSYYGCVRAFQTYAFLSENPNFMYIDQEDIADKNFQSFRLLVQKKLGYSLNGLDPIQSTELQEQVKLMFVFCLGNWERLKRSKVRRIA